MDGTEEQVDYSFNPPEQDKIFCTVAVSNILGIEVGLIGLVHGPPRQSIWSPSTFG